MGTGVGTERRRANAARIRAHLKARGIAQAQVKSNPGQTDETYVVHADPVAVAEALQDLPKTRAVVITDELGAEMVRVRWDRRRVPRSE